MLDCNAYRKGKYYFMEFHLYLYVCIYVMKCNVKYIAYLELTFKKFKKY